MITGCARDDFASQTPWIPNKLDLGSRYPTAGISINVRGILGDEPSLSETCINNAPAQLVGVGATEAREDHREEQQREWSIQE